MKKLIIIFGFIFLFFFQNINQIEATVLTNSDENTNENQILNAKAGILIEESTGKILYKKNIHQKCSPASMTKIMTLLLVFEAIENNQFDFSTTLVCDEYSASMGGTQVYLEKNEKITVDEALKCVCIASANDCAVLLATEVAGSEASFVKKMNEKALSLGCNNTLFSDCTGLNEENNYTSPFDLAIISKELITKYPKILEYTSIKEDYIRKNTKDPFWLVNTNKLIGRVDGINGLKTGYTSFSGYCITLHMKKNNMGLISVVFGYESSKLRNAESYNLLKYGFSNYKLVTVAKKGETIEVINNPCYKKEVKIILKEDLAYLCKTSDNYSYNKSYSYDINNFEINGIINLYDNNNNLLAKANIGNEDVIIKRNLFEILLHIIKKCFI